MNFKVTRIGLLNFWYFDDEVFNFCDGKLLLRGGNGSGKSVTMQSFIPLILDGNKTPSRLDPFGTKEKKIEDYLLGPSDGEQKDESTGYLYLECYLKEKEKYITIGIGLHARKGRPTEFWGFALKNGKRIGIDFQLYKNYGSKVLMTKKELRANIGDGNKIVETQKEYKELVNELLFGFKEIDEYDEFINVLLQLRSPKLSKDYNPTKLMDILSSVLQPLTNEDVRPISEAIEDTNITKEKVATLNNHIKALSNLSKVYQNYNEINLYNKASKVFETKEQINNNKNNLKKLEKNQINIKERLKEIDIKINQLNKELIEITTKLANIDNKDLKIHTEELNQIKIEINKIELIINKEKMKLEKEFNDEKDLQNKLTIASDKLYNQEKEIESLKEDISTLCEEVKLLDININIKNKDINFDYIIDRITKYRSKVNQIKIKLEEKEKLEEILSQKEEENIKIKKELETKQSEKTNQQKIFKEKVDEFKDELNLLDKKSKVVKLNSEIKTKIFNLIDEYSSSNYINVKELYLNETNYYKTSLIEEKSNILAKIENEKKSLNVLNEELNYLKQNEELEYLEENLLKEAEQELINKNIPFIQLYKVIEFKPNIKEEEKNKLEELLISMNILNAKIVPKKYLKDIKNIKSVFLKEGIKKKNNISLYFDVLDNDIVSKEEINNILSTISIDTSDLINITPSSYNLDFLSCYPSSKYESKYIGIVKRKEEHQKNIQLKEKEIELKEKIINNYRNILGEIKEKISDIDIIISSFPSNKNLEEINSICIKLNTEIDLLFERSKNLTIEANNINNSLKQIIEEINKIKENITLPLNLYTYKNTLSLIDELNNNINSLKNSIKVYSNIEEQKSFYETNILDKRNEIEFQNEEIYLKNKTLDELNSKKKAIEEILDNPEYKNLIEEINKLTKRKEEIPNENDNLNLEKGRLQQSLENIANDINNKNSEIQEEELELELQNKILEKEYNLNYVYENEKIDLSKILNDLKNRENSDINNAIGNYMRALNEYRQELLDYRLNTKLIFNENEDLFNEYIEKGLDEKKVVGILSLMSRHDLETTYQGRKLNIFKLSNCLLETIEESNNYITAQERHLFEDVLLKTVGNKIRDRIEASKEWVKKINEIMRLTQIDSNLSFELEWKNKTAYTEDELDTKELVRLLKIDAGSLMPEDNEKLINHFRSQIQKELEFSSLTNESYASIIFKVLDYRNWFEFKLYYKRKSGERRELTNKIFAVLSGGERAKSMYVPLFASIYAKVLNAEKTSLRLIALDEAFAGVDNENIKEMFDILAQLNLDYILTSQSLWGDYSTVKDLSICELIKDEVHKAVGVRHYRWNGNAKIILEKSDLYE